MPGGLAALAALLCLCVAFSAFGRVKAALTPVLAVSATVLYFTLAGVAGLLQPAAWLFYAACFALCALALWRRGGLRVLRPFAVPGFALFFVGALLFLVYFSVRQPLFSEWDEFSTWGVAAKMLTAYHQSYATAPAGWFWPFTQSPALPMLSYFAQFFGAGFAEWKVYWAYNLFMLAAFSALLSPLSFSRWRAAVPAGILFVAVPYFFTVFFRIVYLNHAYMTAYADVAAGVWFGGVLAVYFGGRRRGFARLWPVLLPLAVFTLTKSNLLPLALVAAGVFAVDTAVFARAACRCALRKVWAFFAFFAAVLLGYLVWGLHTGGASAGNAVTGGAATGTGPLSAMLQTVGQLFAGAARTEKFTLVLQNFKEAFFTTRVSMAGAGVVTCLIILFIFAAACALHQNRRQRRRILLAGALLAGGFAGYQFMLLASYAFVFKQSAAEGMFDYERYVAPYYAGWFLLGVFFLMLAALQRGKSPANGISPVKTGLLLCGGFGLYQLLLLLCYGVLYPNPAGGLRQYGLYKNAVLLGCAVFAVLLLSLWVAARRQAGGGARLALTALACGVALLFAAWVPAGLAVFSYSPAQLASQQSQRQLSAAVSAALQPGERVFYVSQSGTGLGWFQYHYTLLPAHVLDYSITGGAPLQVQNDGVTLEKLQAYLSTTGCTAVFIQEMDDAFAAAFAPLFADGLAAARQGPALYRLSGGLYAPVTLPTNA
ncbi:MAG: hypothetical protein ACK5L3_11595 [Oscillospiraceae bacterium]